MATLGLSFGYHDAAAAVVVDGELVCAEHQERFSRIKNDKNFPKDAAEFCVQKIGGWSKVSQIMYYENPMLKLDRIIQTQWRGGLKNVGAILQYWKAENKFFPLKEIRNRFQCQSIPVHNCFHHEAHAASAYFCSPFQEALAVTIDGVGEWDTSSIWLCKNGEMKKVGSSKFPNSIGLLYSEITSFLGFEVNEGEYKVMGLAAFGEPRFLPEMERLIHIDNSLSVQIENDFFDFSFGVERSYTHKLIEVFGEPKDKKSDFEICPENQRFCDIAASLQKATENLIDQLIAGAFSKYGQRPLCMAGGVALNSLANGKLKKKYGDEIFVQPAAGDAGCAVGAAFVGEAKSAKTKEYVLHSPLIGRSFQQNEVAGALNQYRLTDAKEYQSNEACIETAAEALASGKVIGWFRGAAEFGPRALGSRSILADPRGRDTQDRVNEKIKFREKFRPFAPAVLADYASEYFDIADKITQHSLESYMLSITEVRNEFREMLPAITHVDGTARIQSVCKKNFPDFYELISKFFAKSGMPILLNTSFNLRGEPIVGSPQDALNTFFASEIDMLFIENFSVTKDG
jgi:carbamoyltransferase